MRNHATKTNVEMALDMARSMNAPVRLEMLQSQMPGLRWTLVVGNRTRSYTTAEAYEIVHTVMDATRVLRDDWSCVII